MLTTGCHKVNPVYVVTVGTHSPKQKWAGSGGGGIIFFGVLLAFHLISLNLELGLVSLFECWKARIFSPIWNKNYDSIDLETCTEPFKN